MADDCVNCEDGSSVFKLPTPKVGVPTGRFIIPMVRRNGQPSELYPGEKIDPCFLPFSVKDIPVTATGSYTFPEESPYAGLSIPDNYTGITASGVGYNLSIAAGGVISGDFYFNSSTHPVGNYSVRIETNVSGFIATVNNTGTNPVHVASLAPIAVNGVINSVQIIPA